RPDRLQETVGKLRQLVVAAHMLEGGMAPVDHRGRAGMEAEPIHDIFPPFPEVLLELCGEIVESGVAQSNKISRSVIPPMGDLRSPPQLVDAVFAGPRESPNDPPDTGKFSLRGPPREPDDLVPCFLHPVI